MLRKLCFWLGAAILSGPTALDALGQDSFDLPPIRYSESISKDPVALLERKIQRGELVLPQDPQFGVLPGLLKELNVPVESQVLVFSKTSLQIQVGYRLASDHSGKGRSLVSGRNASAIRPIRKKTLIHVHASRKAWSLTSAVAP